MRTRGQDLLKEVDEVAKLMEKVGKSTKKWNHMIEAAEKKDLDKKYGNGGFAYLYWPVEIGPHKDLHITAKFLGKDFQGTKEDVIEALKGMDTDVDPSEMEWEPVTFDTKNDGKVMVLEFKKYPEHMKNVHDALNHLRKDDYPTYRVHATVPKELWEMVSKEKPLPAQLGIKVGPLQLKIDGKVVHTWEA